MVGIGQRSFWGIAPFYIAYGFVNAIRGSLEGFGDLVSASAAAIIALAVRIAASYAMKGVFGDLTIAYAEALSWALMLLLYAARLLQRRMSEKNNKAPEEKV